MAGRQPCKDCGRRPKWGARQRCKTCALRVMPIGDQVEAARERLAAVPLELRRKRTPKLTALAPAGRAWCAGCQSWRDVEDFAKGATQCRPCASAAQHGAMIERTYNLTAAQYDALAALQGGRCAICRARPKSKRLAVDHDHKTGLVRGLLCSRCNHDLMGSAWDSMAMALALWHYMNTPPATGSWRAPELGLVAPGEGGAQRPPKPSAPVRDEFATLGESASESPRDELEALLSVPRLPDDWQDKEPAELHALWRELNGLLLRLDPPPF